MKNITIRKCDINDWQVLQKISIQTFSDTYRDKNNPKHFELHLIRAFNEAQLKKELSDKKCEFYFFEEKENKVIGYLKLNEFEAQTEKMTANDLEVERIYVIKKFHGMGIGKQMIEFAIERAILKKKKNLWLGVWEKNPKAIGFYTKMGFEKKGTHIFKVGEDEQLDYVMVLRVGLKI